MLFCNIDHLDARLVPLTRRAGHQFFLAASSLDQAFAHMELGTRLDSERDQDAMTKQLQQALLAAWHAEQAASGLRVSSQMYTELAAQIRTSLPKVSEEVRRPDLFGTAANQVGFSLDSSSVERVTTGLMNKEVGIPGVLSQLAANVMDISGHVGSLGVGIRYSGGITNEYYRHAHGILREWHPLLVSGQFLSVICYLSSQVSAPPAREPVLA
jgi:hypothetical protein